MFDIELMKFNPAALSFLAMLITALFAFVVCSIIAVTYELTTKGIHRKAHFLQSLALIGIVAATILQAIGESVAIGLGIIGALSIIRFRTALNDQQTIYERMVGTLEFDPEKLIKLQIDKSNSKIAINKLLLEQASLLNKYGIQNQTIDFGDFATIESISKNLERTTLSTINPSELMDLKTEHKKQMLLKEIELESAEKKQWIDFAQIKYTGPHSDDWQEKLSVGLGFRLSNAGNDKLKMQELQIEKEELMRKSKWDFQEKKEKLTTLEYSLQRDIQAYFDFQKIRAEEWTQLQNIGKKIAQKEGTSPLFLLEIAERNLSMKDKALNKKEDLLKNYLKYLQQSGKMCQPAFVNYLKS